MITCAVLAVSLAVAMYLRDKKVIASEFAGHFIIFGPLAIFWLIGASSDKAVFSQVSCFAGYNEMPSGLYADATGNFVTKGDIVSECAAIIVGTVFFEGFAGAWFFTIPEGVKVAVRTITG